MIKIGLAGFGTVGSGVYEIIKERQDYLNILAGDEIVITKILVNNINKERSVKVDKTLFTDSIDVFLKEDYDLMIEAITNLDDAYKIIKTSLTKHTHVVTASKAVISKHFKELFSLSSNYNAGLFIEAAVAGGIPIIKPMLQTLKTNDLNQIKAILNGTTNFILSKMYNENYSFKDALDLAQKLGFAELDPTDDIEGYDALRKLKILSSLAYQTELDTDLIPCTGITGISASDMGYFKELGLIVKLIGTSILKDNEISASIEPILFSESSVFNTVQLSNNIVSLKGDNVGELQFYGQGAGKLPTANSIVSDVIDVLSKVEPIHFKGDSNYTFRKDELLKGRYYVRFELGFNKSEDILEFFNIEELDYSVVNRTDNLVLITEEVTSPKIQTLLKKIGLSRSIALRIESDDLPKLYSPKDKPIVVHKYGGTSLATVEQIKEIASRAISQQKDGHKVVIVLSAMGKRTDELVEMAKKVSNDPSKRELDMLLSTGEQVSISLLGMAIKDLKGKCIPLTGGQSGIITDGLYSDARIIKVKTNRIFKELEANNIVIIAGFQGLNEEDDITTLGRGGSDTTAVALAAALNAVRCEIYTDVDGIYTADPRVVKNARVWSEVTYDEMLELASLGAKVLHPRSVELAKKYSIPLYVKAARNSQYGTLVKEETDMEKVLVRGITSDRDIVKISLMEVPDSPGIAFQLFNRLALKKVAIDIIIQAVSRDNINDISFTVHSNNLKDTLDVCEAYAKEIGSGKVLFDKNVAKLSIVGIGMSKAYDVASTFFKALYESGINIQMISTSEIKISTIIEDKNVDQAINLIHDYFQLGEDINQD